MSDHTTTSVPTHTSPAGDAAAVWRLLAPVVAGAARVRISRDGGRTYPRRFERLLTAELPAPPAAVRIYGPEGTGRCLAADFDLSRGGRAQVDADATAFTALIHTCGGRVLADASPTGGRHVYVPFATPLPFVELRRITQALASLYPSLDALPMLGLTDGCIRPPGAAHKSGGHQQLTTPWTEALDLAAHPNGPAVWNALVDRLTPALRTLEAPPVGEDLDQLTHLPRPGGPVPLAADFEAIARTGTFDATRYASPSEARQAVLTSAAARGHRLVDVARRLETGIWPGLSGFYARYPARHRRAALVRDWRKALALVAAPKAAHNSHTRGSLHTGGEPQERRGPVTNGQEYQFLRRWWNAVHAAETSRYATRAGQSSRLILRALGSAAQRKGSRYVAFGTRNLALACGLDHSTVAAVLRRLRAEPDPLLVLIEDRRGVHGDLYELRIPTAFAETAAWRRWKAGRIEAIHPAFRAIGASEALLYEALEQTPAMAGRLRRVAGLAASTTAAALRTLACHGLAESTPTGWRRGRVSLDTVADLLGVTEIIERIIARYRVERVAWQALLGAWTAPIQTALSQLVPPSAPHIQPPPEHPETAVELLWRELGAVPVPLQVVMR